AESQPVVAVVGVAGRDRRGSRSRAGGRHQVLRFRQQLIVGAIGVGDRIACRIHRGEQIPVAIVGVRRGLIETGRVLRDGLQIPIGVVRVVRLDRGGGATAHYGPTVGLTMEVKRPLPSMWYVV